MSFSATIPSTEGNPFIKTTSLPEGTLFIVVGSILLGLFLIVLAWRIYAIWATYRAARHNEAAFTSLNTAYNGQIFDPLNTDVDFNDSDEFEKVAQQYKSKKHLTMEEKLEEARMQGKYFSPTVQVLNHGSALPITNTLSSGVSSYSVNINPDRNSIRPNPLRFSVAQSGRGSVVNLSSMTEDNASSLVMPSHLSRNTGSASEASSLNVDGPYMGAGPSNAYNRPSSRGTQTQPSTKQKKLRPPSTYLDDLLG
ncbi:hypothetical protein DASB73_001710 [Starmerella bacillaris]|uniref:Vacuolar membrane protein n=1 Tax=Starmerella bacillaris TaxID=1247836 RepID=A0AAV5REP0_STABA|nr:hypothetical protein DASB73_001710 [Starmerella bacillaris]